MTELLDLAPESRPPEERQEGFWVKLKRGLFMTHRELGERMGAAISGRGVLDEETLEHLEEILIAADLGVASALELVERIRRRVRRHETGDLLRLREMLADEMAILLLDAPQPPPLQGSHLVTLVVGVNGSGKTTSIAKLAWRAREEGATVVLVAADTFRAAAAEQLATWAERLGVEIVRQRPGADPAAVVYDALQAARARNAHQVIVDTAGRLHTKANLMAELTKIRRVMDREAVDWERRTLLVLDATTGQNALAQAREFHQAVSIDGVLLSKMDGTAKGGMAVAVARELQIPVLYLGVGEGPEDLVDFRPREFVQAMLGGE